MRYGAGDDRTRGRHSGRHHRGDESGQGSHAWNMPSGTDIYDGVSGRQSRTSKDCHSQAPTSSPPHLDPTTVAAPEARRTRRAPSTAVATISPPRPSDTGGPPEGAECPSATAYWPPGGRGWSCADNIRCDRRQPSATSTRICIHTHHLDWLGSSAIGGHPATVRVV